MIPAGIAVALLFITNLAAFVAQWWDKRLARTNARSRTPERTLLLLGLPLAAPGMLLGMRVFRHKTQKRSFQLKAALVVFANLLIAGVLGWLPTQGMFGLELALY